MTMTQLDLCIYAPGTIGEALYWTLRNTCDNVRAVTLRDYCERAQWIRRVLGGDTPTANVTYERLIEVARTHGPRSAESPLLNVTIRKRFVLLHRALSDAQARGLLEVAPKFPQLRADGTAGKRIHTAEQFEAMRKQLPAPWDIWVTVGWWTGMRTHDLNRMRWGWFRLDVPFRDAAGKAIAPGQWLRHSHKTDGDDRNLVWLPMDEPFHACLSMVTGRGGPADRVTPRWWKSVQRMARACELADVPRISPLDLRRSAASRWLAEGKRDEWIRVALGHKGYGWTDGQDRRPARPSMRTSHYYQPTPGLLAGTAE